MTTYAVTLTVRLASGRTLKDTVRVRAKNGLVASQEATWSYYRTLREERVSGRVINTVVREVSDAEKAA